MPTPRTPAKQPAADPGVDGRAAGAYEWCSIGGHLALDFCNTISWRLDPARTIERLRTPEDLATWFRTRTGHPAPAGLTAGTLADVRALRDATTRLLDSHLEDRPAPPDDVRAVRGAWLAALRKARQPTALPFTADAETIDPTTPALLLAHLALSTGDLLHIPDLKALRRCDGEGCGWLFLDTTKNHSRRWCDPLDCGNRARVRAYARRHREIR